MDVGITTLILFASLVGLLITGLPLAIVLGAIAVFFTYFLWGPFALMAIPANTMGVMQNFILSAIPLFIFMGLMLQKSKVASAMYDTVHKWAGGLRGGLAMGTVVICMFFAAMTGTSGGATVSMGVIALPSMLERKYNKNIVIGAIAAGGALGILIPPSVLMIVYALFANESVGALFAAGVFPGLLMGFVFIAYIAIRCFFQKDIGPALPIEERVSWSEKFKALRGIILPGLLVITVLGVIFFGVATPTEAAAIGALGSIICAAISRSLTWTVFTESCYDTLKLSCMIVWIIIGGSCFAALYTATGAVEFLKDILNTLPVSKYIILAGIQFSFLILGMLMDPGAIIMICTPVFVPLIKSLGFDPVWFGILFIMNMEMGYLTPPFGFNLFYMKAIVPPDVTMNDIYRAIIPFVLLQALCIIIIIIFPDIALWLPRMLIH